VREAVARPAAVVSAATLTSRIAGVARESLFAALFGAGWVADAFVFGFRIPNLLRDLFAEGAFSAAFVPTFSKTRAEKGEAAAVDLARVVLGTLLVVTGAIAVLGIVFAGPVVDVVAAQASGETRELTVRLTRILFPFLPMVAAAAAIMGVLNSQGRYVVPAFSPVAFNGAAIVGGLALWFLGWPAETAVVGWAVVALVGGALQALVQVPALRAAGYRGLPRPDLAFQDPGLRTVVRRMGPVAVALAGTQVTILVTTSIASGTEGWAAALNYAFRLVHLPIGLVGVALGTVALAAASRRAAEGDRAGLEDVVKRGLRLNWFLALPAAAGLAGLAGPVVRLLYERGAFGPDDAEIVVRAVRWYALGIVFYGGIKVATTPFHARGDMRTPMRCSLAGIAANLAVALGGVGPFGFAALPLATAVGAATNYGLLRFFDRRRHGGASAPERGFLGAIAVGSLLIGGGAWALGDLVLRADRAVGQGILLGIATLAAVFASVVLYLVVASRLKIAEASAVGRFLRRTREGSTGP
jgi:putative peptidoglycan lipid II flippase